MNTLLRSVLFLGLAVLQAVRKPRKKKALLKLCSNMRPSFAGRNGMPQLTLFRPNTSKTIPLPGLIWTG